MTRYASWPTTRCALAICIAASLLAACGGGKSSAPPDTCIGKGALPPPPVFFLDYPANGATNVPTNAGVLIEMGANNGQYPNATISVSSVNGAVPLGAPTAVPSPLPTPFATPSPSSPQLPYIAIPLPTLSPNTAYSVAANYMGFADNPPSCTAPVSQTLGTFTTGQ